MLIGMVDKRQAAESLFDLFLRGIDSYTQGLIMVFKQRRDKNMLINDYVYTIIVIKQLFILFIIN